MMPKPAPETELGAKVATWLAPFPASAPVVVVPAYNAYDDTMECVGSLLANTPDTPILLIDDASPDARLERVIAPILEAHGGCYVRMAANRGFVDACNFAFRSCAHRDVVLVNSDLVVPARWLARLRNAAYSASTAATASPLTNYGNILSTPHRNRPTPSLPRGLTVDEADQLVEKASLRLRPEIPTAVGHCTYIRRTALDTVGFFDPILAPGYGEEVDFSQRALAAGFAHVAADDLFVFHKGSRSFSEREGAQARSELQQRHEAIINARYPYYVQWVNATERDANSRLAFAIERSAAALLGYRIALDVTKVMGPTTGTQVVAVELIRALSRSPRRYAHLTLIVADEAAGSDLAELGPLVDDIVPVSKIKRLAEPGFDLVHCPHQIATPQQLHWLRRAGKRLVVSQLDCIFYANPSYATSFEQWQEYRDITRLVYAVTDGVVYLSQSGVDEARQHGLEAPAERSCITYTGVDHRGHGLTANPSDRLADLAGKPYLLMLSTSFKHKNRQFALRVVQVLVARYGWDGLLVIAGPRVSHGGSEGDEQRLLAEHPELQTHVRQVGTVDGAEKDWLIRNARLLLYPSTREGFGIVPFEAAAHGVAAITARLASLPEVLGDDVVYFDSLDPDEGAEVVKAFLDSAELRRRQVAAINARAATYTWAATADRTWEFYERLLALPPRQAALDIPLPKMKANEMVDEPHARTWPQRITRSYRIWRKYGRAALIAEYRQYQQWRKLPR